MESINVCKKCNISKPLSEFSIEKRCKSGFSGTCLLCNKKRNKKYQEENYVEIQARRAIYKNKNRIILRKKAAEYRKNNKEKRNILRKIYAKLNVDKIYEYQKIYRKKNKDKAVEYRKKYYITNREKIKEKVKKWEQEHAVECREYKRKYYIKNADKFSTYCKSNRKRINEIRKKNIETNPMAKLRSVLRNKLSSILILKGFKKGSSTESILGCDWETAKFYIENKFEHWMNWGNHGQWEIDHIIPLVRAKTPEELIVLFHYKNLQPLLKKANRSKSDKLV